MTAFRRLILCAISSGVIAGMAWFAMQYFTVIPLIEKAEEYEATAAASHLHDQHEHGEQERDEHNHDQGWSPSGGWQRNTFTALSTVLTGIGFGALLIAVMSFSGQTLDAKRGAMWGLGLFLCIGVAPPLALPPQPPGVAVADLADRQIWWIATVIATAAGLYLIVRRPRSWPLVLAGIGCLALPHAVGSPAATGASSVPDSLVSQFVTATLITNGIFCLTLGTVAGFVHGRYPLTANHSGG